MPIRVQCSGCGGNFCADDRLAGKRVKCPKCSVVIEVNGRQQEQPIQAAQMGNTPSRPTSIGPTESVVASETTEGSSRKMLGAWIVGGATVLLVVVGLSWFLVGGTRNSLSSKDRNLTFGEKGISIILEVDRNDPSKCLISGPMRIENNKMIAEHTEPGAVVVVGMESGWQSGNQRFEYRHILLRNSDRNLVLAPPGTVLRIKEPKEVLGYKLAPGEFLVPVDSKLPAAASAQSGTADKGGSATQTSPRKLEKYGESLFLIAGVSTSGREFKIEFKNPAVGKQVFWTGPGAVFVSVSKDDVTWKGMTIRYRQIILVDGLENWFLAPPGTLIHIPTEVKILGHTYASGNFIVPSDSKMPE